MLNLFGRARKEFIAGTLGLGLAVGGCPSPETNVPEERPSIITNQQTESESEIEFILNSDRQGDYLGRASDKQKNMMDFWGKRNANGDLEYISDVNFHFSDGYIAVIKFDSNHRPTYYATENSVVNWIDYSNGLKDVTVTLTDMSGPRFGIKKVDLSSLLNKRLNEQSYSSDCSGIEEAWDDLCDGYNIISFIGTVACVAKTADFVNCINGFLHGETIKKFLCENAPECNGVFVNDRSLVEQIPFPQFNFPRLPDDLIFLSENHNPVRELYDIVERYGRGRGCSGAGGASVFEKRIREEYERNKNEYDRLYGVGGFDDFVEWAKTGFVEWTEYEPSARDIGAELLTRIFEDCSEKSIR